MRAALVVAIAAAVLLGACGGGSGSNSSATSSGTSQGSTGKGASRHEKGSRKRGRERKRGRAPGASSESKGNVFFYQARSRCATIPLEALFRIYQAKSDDPKDVATAYADREAPAPLYKQAMVDGCLAGIKSRPRP